MKNIAIIYNEDGTIKLTSPVLRSTPVAINTEFDVFTTTGPGEDFKWVQDRSVTAIMIDPGSISMVVLKGNVAWAIVQWRKLARDPNIRAVKVEENVGQLRDLKNKFPHATLKKYEDTTLSNNYRSMVDKAISKTKPKQ